MDGVTGRAGIGQRGSVVGVFSSGIGLDFFKKRPECLPQTASSFQNTGTPGVLLRLAECSMTVERPISKIGDAARGGC